MAKANASTSSPDQQLQKAENAAANDPIAQALADPHYVRSLSFRELLAVHCPPMPDWFVPQMPERPTFQVPSGWDSGKLELWNRFQNGRLDGYEGSDEDAPVVPVNGQPVRITQDLLEEFAAANKQQDAIKAQARDWDTDQARVGVFQWPWFYADRVLAGDPLNAFKKGRR